MLTRGNTFISNLARHFSARAGVRCVPTSTMDTAVIHRNAFSKTSPPGEQYSCGDNAPGFRRIRGYGFTGLRAGLRFDGRPGQFASALAIQATGRIERRGIGSSFDTRGARHVARPHYGEAPRSFSLAPNPAQNFNAQGVDGFHFAPLTETARCNGPSASTQLFSKTRSPRPRNYAWSWTKCRQDQTGSRQSGPLWQ